MHRAEVRCILFSGAEMSKVRDRVRLLVHAVVMNVGQSADDLS